MAKQITHANINNYDASIPLSGSATHKKAPKKSRTLTHDGLNSRLRKRVNRTYDPVHVRAALASGIAKNGVRAAAFALVIADRRRLAATTQTAALRVEVDSGSDAIEIHGVRASVINNERPERIAVFSRGRDGLMESIGECGVRLHDVARTFARAIADRIGVPLNDHYLAAQLATPRRRHVGADLRALAGLAHRDD